MKSFKPRILMLCGVAAFLLVALAGAIAAGHARAADEAASARFELISVVRGDAVAGAHDIEVRDGLAYVAGKANRHMAGRPGRFAVVDVSDPEIPVILSALNESSHEALYNAETVLLIGDVCILGTNDLMAVDIAVPQDVKILSVVRHREIDRINGMIVWDDKAIAANKSGRLNVFDVADPRKPSYLGSVDTRMNGNLISPHDIARFGSKYLVVPSAGRDAPVHFGIYEVSDDGNGILPVSAWQCVGTVSDSRLAGANRIVVDEQYAYVACHYSNRIGVIDLADPAEPELAATIPTCDVEPDGLALKDDVLFVGTGRSVEAIGVSTPRAPTSLACYTGGPLFTKPEVGKAANAHDLVVAGGLVYVTAQRDGAVGILRFERSDEK